MKARVCVERERQKERERELLISNSPAIFSSIVLPPIVFDVIYHD